MVANLSCTLDLNPAGRILNVVHILSSGGEIEVMELPVCNGPPFDAEGANVNVSFGMLIVPSEFVAIDVC